MNTLEKILKEIKTLKSKQDNGNRDYYIGYMSALSTIEGAIAELKENAGWIPTSERLPETTDFVLITVSGEYEWSIFANAVLIGNYGAESGGWIIDGYEGWVNPNVTAWMELPEGYKGESL